MRTIPTSPACSRKPRGARGRFTSAASVRCSATPSGRAASRLPDRHRRHDQARAADRPTPARAARDPRRAALPTWRDARRGRRRRGRGRPLARDRRDDLEPLPNPTQRRAAARDQSRPDSCLRASGSPQKRGSVWARAARARPGQAHTGSAVPAPRRKPNLGRPVTECLCRRGGEMSRKIDAAGADDREYELAAA